MKPLETFGIVSTCLVVLCGAEIYDEFKVDWCRQRNWRIDWEGFKKPCDTFDVTKSNLQEQAKAGGTDVRTMFGTDLNQTKIISTYSKPAGEFSRLFIQSRTTKGKEKDFGGDAWRVRLIGPSTIDGTVFDLDNGLYEVLFLVMEPGVYTVRAILDYTICDGIRDPPMDWFESAHCSGKNKNANLNEKLCSDMKQYINQPIEDGSLTISPPQVSESEIQSYMRQAENECGIKCNFMWDGFGRWVNDSCFKPYMSIDLKDYNTVGSLVKNYHHQSGKGILWVYGDSLSFYFYEALTKPQVHDLCQKAFENCTVSYNWIYPKTLYELTETCKEVNLNIPLVLKFLRQVLVRPDMDKDSALLFNAGAHYVKTTGFDTYRQVIDAVIAESKKLYKGKFVWKSTTAIHGQTAEIMGAFRRFITNQRIQLYNAYANSAMCTNGVTILDVYPVSASYPDGTKDGIHYLDHVFASVYSILQKYFSSEDNVNCPPSVDRQDSVNIL